MKEYIFLAVCTVIMALQLQFCKIYQLKANTKKANLAFPVITGVTAFIMFFIISGFTLAYSTFSFLIALGGAVITTAVSLIGLKIVEEVPVGLYSAFLMLGALIIPFLYGVLALDEEVKLLMVLGIIVLIFALVYNSVDKNEKQRKSVKGIIYCFIVFLLNGTFGVLSKIHQISPSAVETGSFLQWVTIFQTVFSAIIFVVSIYLKKDKEVATDVVDCSNDDATAINDCDKCAKKTSLLLIIAIGAGYSISWGVSFYLQLLALKVLPVSLVNPIVTSAVIIFSWLFSLLLFKEKIKAKQIISTALIIIGIVLFFI